jgi:hypothetical protein
MRSLIIIGMLTFAACFGVLLHEVQGVADRLDQIIDLNSRTLAALDKIEVTDGNLVEVKFLLDAIVERLNYAEKQRAGLTVPANVPAR